MMVSFQPALLLNLMTEPLGEANLFKAFPKASGVLHAIANSKKKRAWPSWNRRPDDAFCDWHDRKFHFCNIAILSRKLPRTCLATQSTRA